MILFLRKIRKNLLSDNKITQYSLFALGEILLVIIGILVALQINNWNTEKQELKELKGCLSNGAKNLNADLIHVLEIKQFRDSSIEQSQYFFEEP